MDTDAMHLWLDELHGELCGRYEVHLVLPRERGAQLRDRVLPLGACSNFCAHQQSG